MKKELEKLLPIVSGQVETTEQVISARDLHSFLGIKSKFATWITNRIKQYEFIENEEFISFSKNLENGGRTKEYAITLQMSKELCMVENNEKGKIARRYFIEQEKQLKRLLQTTVNGKLLEKVDKAVAITGSLNKLAKRIGISGATLTHLRNNLYEVKGDMLDKIENGCDRIIKYGMGYTTEEVDMLSDLTEVLVEVDMNVDCRKKLLKIYNYIKAA